VSRKGQQVKDIQVDIEIPQELYDRLAQIIHQPRYESVDAFVLFILGDIVHDGQIESGNQMTLYELRRLRQKLRALGYL
jgi:hypothetical protein